MLSALLRPFSRREAGRFVCFFRYRARLLRSHPGRAWPVARLTRTRMPNRPNVGMYARLLLGTAASKYENVLVCYSTAAKSTVRSSGENGRRRARLCLRGQREGPPRATQQGVLDAGRIRLVSEKLQAFYARGNHGERGRFFFC